MSEIKKHYDRTMRELFGDNAIVADGEHGGVYVPEVVLGAPSPRLLEALRRFHDRSDRGELMALLCEAWGPSPAKNILVPVCPMCGVELTGSTAQAAYDAGWPKARAPFCYDCGSKPHSGVSPMASEPLGSAREPVAHRALDDRVARCAKCGLAILPGQFAILDGATVSHWACPAKPVIAPVASEPADPAPGDSAFDTLRASVKRATLSRQPLDQDGAEALERFLAARESSR